MVHSIKSSHTYYYELYIGVAALVSQLAFTTIICIFIATGLQNCRVVSYTINLCYCRIMDTMYLKAQMQVKVCLLAISIKTELHVINCITIKMDCTGTSLANRRQLKVNLKRD